MLLFVAPLMMLVLWYLISAVSAVTNYRNKKSSLHGKILPALDILIDKKVIIIGNTALHINNARNKKYSCVKNFYNFDKELLLTEVNNDYKSATIIKDGT